MSNDDNTLTSDKILDLIDVNTINITDKKKRGRPKKNVNMNEQVMNTIKNISNNVLDVNEEMILHLAITKEDIKMFCDNITTNDIKELTDIQNNSNDIIDTNNLNNLNNIDNTNNINNLNNLNNTNNINILNDKDLNDDNLNNSELIETDRNTDKNSDKFNSDKNKYIDINSKNANIIIKRLKTKIDDLLKFIENSMPMYFTQIKSYPIDLKLFDKNNNEFIPKLTTLCCWWDTEPFEHYPVYIPDKYYKEKYYVFGNFCSFNCACAYNLNLRDDKVLERNYLLTRMFYEINKTKIKSINEITINPSGDKELLKKFGGHMTINDFRENSKIIGRHYNKLMPPCQPINVIYDEVTNSKNINNQINK